MVLVDISQVAISGLMTQMNVNGGNLDEHLARHFVLNSLRMYRNKFKNEYGEFIICADGKNVWRKEIFPNYKAARKKSRKTDKNDWKEIYRIIDDILSDLDNVFPYKYIREDGMEADDVIASIVMHERGWYNTDSENGTWLTSNEEPILILSGDKDMGQLQRFSNVSQYSPLTKKWINVDNPHTFLREHIIRGDRSDGIPNFLSDDDVFITDKRQKPISSSKLQDWVMIDDPKDFANETMTRGFTRNEILIDLTKIPKEYYIKAINSYKKEPNGSRSKLLTYFIKKKLKNLIEHLSEF